MLRHRATTAVRRRRTPTCSPTPGRRRTWRSYLALVKPGDTILAMRLDQGGHLTHGSPVSITGKTYRFVAYGVTKAQPDGSGERIDLDMVRDLAKRERPRLILAGTTAYSRIIDPHPFREIADEVDGALFMFDAAFLPGRLDRRWGTSEPGRV